VS
ncbi:4-alpha-glucanotransferase, partial [Vibrio parahaemolyticus VP2007-007]|jgi:hypothetical protein